MAMSTVGFVGLGRMGTPMCQHLLNQAYEVHLYDVNPQALTYFQGTSAHPADSLQTLAQTVDVVILMLPDSHVVEQVVLGEHGLGTGLTAGKVLIDMSSSLPSSTQRIAQTLATREIHMLDAPVSGGVQRAKEGTLAIMVGGEQPVFEQYQKLLQVFGNRLFYVGNHGAGHLTKSLNNLLSATTLISAVEAVLLGIRAGLDPTTFIDVVNASTGRSNSTEIKFPRYILPGSFDDGFLLKLMSKDLKIAMTTAMELEFPLFIGSTVNQLWQAALAQGLGEDNHTAIYKFLERLTMPLQNPGQ
jgi:3-hydroxyisobutyrate dehydrogenase-like beta-hydroxyacid dehydrogenase